MARVINLKSIYTSAHVEGILIFDAEKDQASPVFSVAG